MRQYCSFTAPLSAPDAEADNYRMEQQVAEIRVEIVDVESKMEHIERVKNGLESALEGAQQRVNTVSVISGAPEVQLLWPLSVV